MFKHQSWHVSDETQVAWSERMATEPHRILGIKCNNLKPLDKLRYGKMMVEILKFSVSGTSIEEFSFQTVCPFSPSTIRVVPQAASTQMKKQNATFPLSFGALLWRD